MRKSQPYMICKQCPQNRNVFRLFWHDTGDTLPRNATESNMNSTALPYFTNVKVGISEFMCNRAC